MKAVTIIGGLTMDLTYYVSEWPEVKKAPQAKSYSLAPGGKGLNIATALKRLGANVNFISSVGKDKLSESIFQTLIEERFSTEGIFVKEGVPTDLIAIIVNPDGLAGFIGTQLANQQLKTEDIKKMRGMIEKSDGLIVTLEVPDEATSLALKIAKQKSILTLFNPSPPNDFPRDNLRGIDFFVPNKWEAGVLARSKKRLSSRQLCQEFLSLGPKNVIITEHQRGGVLGSKKQIKRYSAFKVKTIDETGAGDAFCSALCVSLLEGNNLDSSITFATAAGALACTKMGARNAMPTKKEVKKFLENSKN